MLAKQSHCYVKCHKVHYKYNKCVDVSTHAVTVVVIECQVWSQVLIIDDGAGVQNVCFADWTLFSGYLQLLYFGDIYFMDGVVNCI